MKTAMIEKFGRFDVSDKIPQDELISRIARLEQERKDEKLAAQGYMTYDFFLPGLILDALENGDGSRLKEWAEELDLYENAELKRASSKQLSETKVKYNRMLQSMKQAESSMTPVLRAFRDNVLFLKHNLNAQAIGSLRTEFKNLKGEINRLITKMNNAIESSNSFISNLEK